MRSQGHKNITLAAGAHTDLNVFGLVQRIMEGGYLYAAGSQRAAAKIIRICEAEQAKRLRDYDRAVAKASDGETR